MRIQLSSIKPDINKIGKNVKKKVTIFTPTLKNKDVISVNKQ